MPRKNVAPLVTERKAILAPLVAVTVRREQGPREGVGDEDMCEVSAAQAAN
jgi:hypothetical protein